MNLTNQTAAGTRVIDEIAFQTNILALDAAVGAARNIETGVESPAALARAIQEILAGSGGHSAPGSLDEKIERLWILLNGGRSWSNPAGEPERQVANRLADSADLAALAQSLAGEAEDPAAVPVPVRVDGKSVALDRNEHNL